MRWFHYNIDIINSVVRSPEKLWPGWSMDGQARTSLNGLPKNMSRHMAGCNYLWKRLWRYCGPLIAAQGRVWAVASRDWLRIHLLQSLLLNYARGEGGIGNSSGSFIKRGYKDLCLGSQQFDLILVGIGGRYYWLLILDYVGRGIVWTEIFGIEWMGGIEIIDYWLLGSRHCWITGWRFLNARV